MMSVESITALVSLTFMEIVLGIDNVIFIALITGRLPKLEQAKARNLGLAFALITRLLLLFSISWLMGLTEPILEIAQHSFSFRDLVLIVGGIFLIAKATKEIHDKMEHIEPDLSTSGKAARNMGLVILQIMIIDIVFSLDSVITAIGMAQNLTIMIVAMLISMLVMLLSAKFISEFVEKHPTIKILALSFLILIGVFLTLEGMKSHIDKNYIYFAMFFAFAVEIINMRYRRKAKGV
jgi:predicted tellurium resistance membrane protein TerC